MNSSLWSADRITHLKIVAVALMAAVAVVGIGIGARGGNSSPAELVAIAKGPVMKAHKSLDIVTNDILKVR